MQLRKQSTHSPVGHFLQWKFCNFLHVVLPLSVRIGSDAAIVGSGEHQPGKEGIAVAGRHGDTALRVHPDFLFPDER